MANFRKILATLSTVAILSTLVVTTAVSAASYTDVPADHWAKSYVDTLVDLGVFTGTGNFRPADNMSRAEFVKSVVVAAGLEGSTAITFPDVKDGDWFAPYVKTAVANGVIGGYANGKFGPNDSLTREQAAKITVNAFGFPVVTPAAASFSDVKASDWSYSFVETLVSYGIVSGYGNGKFGPMDNVKREQVAKIVALSLNPEAPVVVDDEGNPVVVTGGDLGVSVSASTPGPATVPCKATAAELLALDFTAGDTDVTVSKLKLHKSGVGAPSTTFQAYLYDGNDRLTSGKGLNSANEMEFSNVGLVVASGKTKTVMVKADMGTTCTSGEMQLEVVSAGAVTSTADAVSGDFPVVSETIGLSATNAGVIEIAKNGSITNPKIGEAGATVAKFTLNAATEAASVSQLGLYVTGTVSVSDVTNLKLYVAGTADPLAEVDGINGKDLAQFVLDTPYVIEKGATKSFYVTADMSPGRNTDTLAIYIDENTDVVAIGGTYGFGMAVTKTNYMSTTCALADSSTCSFSTLEGGDITITSSGPTAADIAVNAKDVVLMNFTVNSISDVTFKNFEVGLLGSESADTTEGLLSSATANFTDIKVINTETGETLMGPVDVTSFTDSTLVKAISESTADATNFVDSDQAYYLFTDEFSMAAGETLKLALTTDVANTSTLANMTLISSLQLGTYPTIKDVNNKSLTNTTSLVPASTITGKTMTVKSPSLTMSLASTPVTGSTSKVKGTKGVKFSGISFACGSASDCKVTDVALTGYIYDGSWGAGVGGTVGRYLNAAVGSVALQDASGAVIAAAKSVQSSGAVSFTNLAWTIKAGESVTAYVVGDISSNATATDQYAFAIAAVTDVTVEDKDGNALATASKSGTPNSATTVYVTASSGGTIVVSVDTATPKENIIVAGSADQSISKFKFTTTREAFVVKKIALNNIKSAITALGDYDNNVSSLKISYTNSAGAVETKTATLTLGNAEFSGMDMYLPADDSAVLSVSATLNTITGGATAGTYLNLNPAFENFEAVAASSGSTYKTDALLETNGATTNLKLDTAVGSMTYTDPSQTNSGTVTFVAGSSSTLTLTGALGGSTQLPVGTIVKIANSTPVYMILTTAYTGGTSMVGIAINAGATGTGKAVTYVTPGAATYLAASNQMVVYETLPTLTLNPGSPAATSRSASSADTIFKFDVAANANEKVIIAAGTSQLSLALGLDGSSNNSGTLSNATATYSLDGTASSILLTGFTAGDAVSFDAGASYADYTRISFWMLWSDAASVAAPTFSGSYTYGMEATATTDPVGNTALSATLCNAASDTLVTATWYYCDIDLGAAAAGEFLVIEMQEMTNLVAADTMYFDQVRLYNNKIRVNLASDGSMAAAGNTLTTYLKGGASNVTGYVSFNTTSSALVDFFPTTDFEVAKGQTANLYVETATTTLITDQAGTDDLFTPSITYGTSTDGTAIPGGFLWYDTNAYVEWLGYQSGSALNGNTLRY